MKAQCGVITGANAGQLTIDYRYAAGTEIPSGNAVLVKAEGAVKIPLMVSKHNTSVVAENLLKGQAATGMIPEDASKKFYKLAYNNFDTKTGLGFYWGAVNGAAFEVPAGLAYLELPKEVAAKCFLLDGTTTGVEGVEVEQNAPAKTVYTLDGRKVDAHNLTKGIYIVNGKKVIVK